MACDCIEDRLQHTQNNHNMVLQMVEERGLLRRRRNHFDLCPRVCLFFLSSLMPVLPDICLPSPQHIYESHKKLKIRLKLITTGMSKFSLRVEVLWHLLCICSVLWLRLSQLLSKTPHLWPLWHDLDPNHNKWCHSNNMKHSQLLNRRYYLVGMYEKLLQCNNLM